MSESNNDSTKTVGLLLVGCGCLVAGIFIVGVLAAIAIPAFIQFQNRAIAAEATATIQWQAEQVGEYYRDHCAFPPSLPPTADPAICCGGERCTPDETSIQAWEDAGIFPPREAMYFSYETERTGPSTYEIRATADYRCQEPNHTEIIQLRDDSEAGAHGTDCKVSSEPIVVINEFE